MPTMYRRERLRDRARHISTAATAPAPLQDDEFPEPWMAPSRRATAADTRRPWALPCRPPSADEEIESLYNETPLFDKSPIASRVIGFAIAIAVGMVLYLLVSGR